jgi:hypothetical protein
VSAAPHVTGRAADEPDAVDAAYERRVERLVDVSEDNAHDAYADVPWDEPGFELDPTDPRLRCFGFDPLAHTDWYGRLEPIEQARVGLRRAAVNLRIGWEFENYLQQGLLVRALKMDNSDVAFRYVQHEVAEESHHSMMFYEFNRRYAPEVKGLPLGLKVLANWLVQRTSRHFPEAFFMLVLGGEVPIDHVQRLVLKEEHVHPLLERIMRIHVEEEARHVAFANLELRRRVPRLSRWRRFVLSVFTPMAMGIMTRMMVRPSPWQLRYEGVPNEDVRATYRRPENRQLLKDSAARIRRLCHELGLITPVSRRVWRHYGIWDESSRSSKASTTP